jgi:hypothetical protein
MTLEEAKDVLAALVRERVEFVVIGSMAMAAQGLVRATHDRSGPGGCRQDS